MNFTDYLNKQVPVLDESKLILQPQCDEIECIANKSNTDTGSTSHQI